MEENTGGWGYMERTDTHIIQSLNQRLSYDILKTA
jgi:hypothetical protein